MSAASLSLLKKGKKDAVSEELEKPEAPAPAPTADPSPPAEEDQVVDIENMSGDELTALLKQEGVATPENWEEMPVEHKRAWMVENLESIDEPEVVQDHVDAEIEKAANAPAYDDGSAADAAKSASKPFEQVKDEVEKAIETLPATKGSSGSYRSRARTLGLTV